MAEPPTPGPRIVGLPPHTLAAMRAGLPDLIDRMVLAVIAEVPALAAAAEESWRPVIDASADQLLGALLNQLHASTEPLTAVPMQDVLDTAYRFGRREARNGRPTEVQLAAYRVGARELWRDWSSLAVRDGIDRDQISAFAEMFFAYLDQISAAGVAGYAEEQAKSGLDRERQRERLVRLVLSGAPTEELERAAAEANWVVPRTLTAVVLASRRHAAISADPRTLNVPEDAIEEVASGQHVVLVCDVGGTARAPFLVSLDTANAVVGPATPWQTARSSVRRAVRAAALRGPDAVGVLDTDEFLPELVVSADSEALADLRNRVLAPLAGMPDRARDRLVETLRSWLLHQGRREDVAAELYVSPSTIRYRLRQLRDAYGDRLQDSRTIAELTVALAVT
ncbi:helix-turn-helix domain-containing protein [Mycobacterium sp. PSTR-4-N]|uniref:helix-turn-helix domain-containing protein n=1 Tax=Mycobacterium sp. PSTR-4-N TaxID=2917745 RepID=UPI001F14F463|nr:helix-turn-helix domain-containing protein [Mycobacterium sp. PSTR-4-N]MCG7594569.1 helix-turn-helix domain-containing protein [Mycobacterium sp. PSTR-4-N]